ncbi:TPA: hypothetical protein DEB04_00155 [Candidatus Giovannonibacteria bacterium]|nr:MAG: hypothetical protein A2433_00260 [Candidatus Giovannonibacteria bacterium RIFOXYC1_FULL_48_8]OGF96458.1 MAG: hypothetical protein A2613_02780 [Candidatus Giovannonibacteria bacterium RIFOXYD1_FULL_48_21]HBT81127.1 hypothetical protein [Candidatus Giovannonibacteria bacterium]
MAKDWTKIWEKYKGLWVALDEDEETVLGAGKTVREALEEAKKKTDKTPYLTRMPEKLVAYVGVL